MLVDAILGYVLPPWSVVVLVKDVKLFLEDFPNVSLLWISRLCNLAVHESARWVFNVIRSGSGSVFEVPSTVKVVCNHE